MQGACVRSPSRKDCILSLQGAPTENRQNGKTKKCPAEPGSTLQNGQVFVGTLTPPASYALCVPSVFRSPPCQPFCRVGNKMDEQDTRSASFRHLLSLLKSTKKPPSHIFLENVQGFDGSQTHHRLLEVCNGSKCGGVLLHSYKYAEGFDTSFKVSCSSLMLSCGRE